MAKTRKTKALLQRRKYRVRKRVTGTSEQPRLRVNRTLKHIYAQIIDDTGRKTLVAESSVALKIVGGNVDAAKAVGKAIAEKSKG